MFFRTRALTAREKDERSSSPILRKRAHADGRRLSMPSARLLGFQASGPAVRLGHQILLLVGGCGME